MYERKLKSFAVMALALAAALALGACGKKVNDTTKTPGSSSAPMSNPSSSNSGSTDSSKSSPPATTDSAATPPAAGASAPKY